MNKDGLLTCLLPNECIQIEINKDLEGEYLWLHGAETLLIIEKKTELWLHPGFLILPSQPLQVNQLYRGKTSQGEQFFLFFEWIEIDTGTYATYNFPSLETIQIGRGDCDIQYHNDYVSSVHAQMIRKHHQLWLVDMDSRNGVYVNHKRCSKQLLHLGDCIYIMGLQIIIGNDCFAINQRGHVKLCDCIPYDKKAYETVQYQPPMMIYPFHEQYTLFQLPTMQIQNPPSMNQHEKMPFLYTLGPSMTMGVASLTSAFFSLQYALVNKQPMTSVMPTMMMSFSMVASTMVWPLLLRHYEHGRDKKKEIKRRKDYQGYLQLQKRQIQESLCIYRKNLDMLYHADIEAFIQEKQKLYQYQMISEEAITLCIGIGNTKVEYPFMHQEQSLTLYEDEVLQMKEDFLKNPYVLEQVPIYENLRRHCLWYVNGSEEEAHAYMVYLILQLCATYTPTQMRIVLAYEDVASSLHFLRFLPHVFDDKQRRYLCHNTQTAQQVSMFIHQSECPTVIFSCSKRLSEAMHVHRLCELSNVSAFLFHEIASHVSFPHRTLHLHGQELQDEIQRVMHWFPIQNLYKVIEDLANICFAGAQDLHFPTMYSFLRMFHVKSVEQLHIYTRWIQNDSSQSLVSPIGVNAANELILLDVHEKAHGPHGIIAGMTGSGKSELLITLILSMAVNYHPNDISFILIDYKGGGMAKALENIPHIAGIITNLDGNMIQRSLNSLDSELLRRQRIFIEAAKQLQLPSIDIYAYQKLYHQQVVSEALPHLLIVADEFAELKQQQPEFMEQLIRSARIGRSLGIHLLLATQKPSGVVDDQIWSNARFHLCLKVQEKADSMDMLKRDDGAKLNDTGRFYLQVGYNELFEEGQSAYTKIPYNQDSEEVSEQGQIEQIDTLGNGIAKGKKITVLKQCPSTLEMIVKALQQTAQLHHVKPYHIWVPPLPYPIPLNKSDQTMIALADDPLRQCQFSLHMEVSTLTHMLLFAMNMQESCGFIKTILYQICTQTSPADMRILFFDFAPIKFQECSKIPHVYAYIQNDHEEDIKFLKDYLEQELQARKERKKKQRILLCVHHLIAFLEVYEEWESLLYLLARDGEQYGITLLLSATSANDVRYRLLQQFTYLFAFQLRDESDYTTILGKPFQPLRITGRAYWKHEDIYEVQCADASILLQTLLASFKDEHYERFISLPQHVSMQALKEYFYEKQPYKIPIGIRKDTRTPYYVDTNFLWILSGSGCDEMLQMLANCPFTSNLSCVTLTQFTKEAMENLRHCGKDHLYHMDASILSDFLCATWIQEHRKEVKLLWIGSGIESIRYLFNIPMKYQELYAQDAYIIAEDIQMVRVMENI